MLGRSPRNRGDRQAARCRLRFDRQAPAFVGVRPERRDGPLDRSDDTARPSWAPPRHLRSSSGTRRGRGGSGRKAVAVPALLAAGKNLPKNACDPTRLHPLTGPATTVSPLDLPPSPEYPPVQSERDDRPIRLFLSAMPMQIQRLAAAVHVGADGSCRHQPAVSSDDGVRCWLPRLPAIRIGCSKAPLHSVPSMKSAVQPVMHGATLRERNHTPKASNSLSTAFQLPSIRLPTAFARASAGAWRRRPCTIAEGPNGREYDHGQAAVRRSDGRHGGAVVLRRRQCPRGRLGNLRGNRLRRDGADVVRATAEQKGGSATSPFAGPGRAPRCSGSNTATCVIRFLSGQPGEWLSRIVGACPDLGAHR
jgi:hypothetical protein